MGLSFEKENSSVSKLNLQLQKKFDEYKAQLTRASSSLCKLNFIEVPILYTLPKSYSRIVYVTKYPSLTNGLLLGDRYFVVDIDNNEIKLFFEKSLVGVGLKVIWLPLKKELYSDGIVDGYLHCLV